VLNSLNQVFALCESRVFLLAEVYSMLTSRPMPDAFGWRNESSILPEEKSYARVRDSVRSDSNHRTKNLDSRWQFEVVPHARLHRPRTVESSDSSPSSGHSPLRPSPLPYHQRRRSYPKARTPAPPVRWRDRRFEADVPRPSRLKRPPNKGQTSLALYERFWPNSKYEPGTPPGSPSPSGFFEDQPLVRPAGDDETPSFDLDSSPVPSMSEAFDCEEDDYRRLSAALGRDARSETGGSEAGKHSTGTLHATSYSSEVHAVPGACSRGCAV